MSEPDRTPENAPKEASGRAAPPPPSPGSARPVLTALGFLLLFVGFGVLWSQQRQTAERLAELAVPQPALDAGQIAQLNARLRSLEERIAALPRLDQRLTTLEQRPAPPPPPPAPKIDLAPLEVRVAALEHVPPPENAPPPPEPQAPSVDLGPLESRVANLETQLHEVQARPEPTETAGAPAPGPLNEKIDRVERAADQLRGQIDGLGGRLDATDRKIAALDTRAGQVERLERALVALDAGQPLGDLPGAPPALARFAHSKPPTEAELRLAFPAAAAAAETASKPEDAGTSFAERMWLKAQRLIRVQHGNKLLIGPPAAAMLGLAHEKLEAGDLAGAMAVLGGLDPAAAAAMAEWRGRAQALLDARGALATLAKS